MTILNTKLANFAIIFTFTAIITIYYNQQNGQMLWDKVGQIFQTMTNLNYSSKWNDVMFCENYFNEANCSEILHMNQSDRHRLISNISKETLEKLKTTLLVIHYNTPQYGSAKRNFELYSQIFAKIVFCGPEVDESAFWPHSTNDGFYHLDKNVAPFIAYGKYGLRDRLNVYICVPKAMKLFPNPNFSGIIAMSDDVVLNFWNIDKFKKSFDQIWLLMNRRRMLYKPFDIDQVYNFPNIHAIWGGGLLGILNGFLDHQLKLPP